MNLPDGIFPPGLLSNEIRAAGGAVAGKAVLS